MKRSRLARRKHRRYRSRCPPLRFTPYAWAKLLVLRDLGPTEVGGFGVSPRGDLLLVEDVQLVQQVCTPVTVKFDDAAVADYFDGQVDAGRLPNQFARIWLHTHPGDSPFPSVTDESTFDRCFGNLDWAVMVILARGGQTYARLRLGSDPGGEYVLPVEVDFATEFPAAAPPNWKAEFQQHVSVDPWPLRDPGPRAPQRDVALDLRKRFSRPTEETWLTSGEPELALSHFAESFHACE